MFVSIRFRISHKEVTNWAGEPWPIYFFLSKSGQFCRCLVRLFISRLGISLDIIEIMQFTIYLHLYLNFLIYKCTVKATSVEWGRSMPLLYTLLIESLLITINDEVSLMIHTMTQPHYVVISLSSSGHLKKVFK